MKPSQRCEIKITDVERAVEAERDAWSEAVEQVLTGCLSTMLRDQLVDLIAKRVERNRMLKKGAQS